MNLRSARKLATLLLLASIGIAAAADDALERRLAVIPDAGPSVDALAEALDDPDPVVARTAARALPALGPEARVAIGRALRHDDMLVRRTAAMNLGKLGRGALELIERAIRDDDPMVRQGAIYALVDLPPSAEVSELLEQAREDENQLVRRAVLLVSRAAYRTAETISLPKSGWRFNLDPDDVGRNEGWFAADFDDTDWNEIEIEQAWQEAGYDYVGVAWYRRTVQLPEREEPHKAMLGFEGVDESAWLWVNGQYAGSHDIGPSGWDKPFRLDVGSLLRWGRENQITVRVMNTAHAGGIWRPVSVVVLEPAR